MTFREQSGKSYFELLSVTTAMPLTNTLEKESRRRALTRRLRQVMDDALPGELAELAVPAPRAEFLTVVFLEQ